MEVVIVGGGNVNKVHLGVGGEGWEVCGSQLSAEFIGQGPGSGEVSSDNRSQVAPTGGLQITAKSAGNATRSHNPPIHLW
jgi:hypothetical protein